MVLTNYPIGESLPDPLFVFKSDDTTLVWMNNAAETWLRRPISTMEGSLAVDIASGFEEFEAKISETARNSTSFRGHDLPVNVRRKDFTCRYQIFNCAAGVALHINPKEVGIGIDQSSTRAQPVIMLGKMLAHELKNPLAGIRGAAQLLEADLERPDDLELTELIKTEVDRVGRLAERMENFGQSEPDSFTPFNVHTVLRKAMLLFENRKQNKTVNIIEIFDPSLPDIFGNEDAIMQVVVNLLGNAIDAIELGDRGDCVEIKTKYRAGIRKRMDTGLQQALPVEVQIIDNGPGVPEKLRDRIFQPFVTSKANGQGLGLALISKIVEDHGGLIEVVSEPGRTVFSVLLPVPPRI